MLSIHFEPHIKGKFYIKIKTYDREYFDDPIDMIDKMFDNLNNKAYFIMINGADGTIKNLIEEMRSQNQVLIDNGKHNRFVKNLPTLFLFTAYPDDIEVFKSYIGAFSEGFMSLFIINDLEEYILSPDVNKDDVISYINKNSIIEIGVTSDAKIFELQSNSQETLLRICNKLCKSMLDQ